MTDESRRRSEFVGSAAGVPRAWERLYERLLQLEFDGYAGADADVFLRAMETIKVRTGLPPLRAVSRSTSSGSSTTK